MIRSAALATARMLAPAHDRHHMSTNMVCRAGRGRACDAEHHAAELHPARIAVPHQEHEPEGGTEGLQDARLPVDDVEQPDACRAQSAR